MPLDRLGHQVVAERLVSAREGVGDTLEQPRRVVPYPILEHVPTHSR